jgi:CPA1 family monovalent cation:H+ antiporter
MAASREAPKVMPARMRVPTWAVWEVAVFVLNVLAFILVGFQLKSIATRITAGTGIWYATFAGAVTVAVIVSRIAWVSGAAWFSRWRCRPRLDGVPGPKDTVALSGKGAVVVGWCGMRGTVTLAAALALPQAFPSRDLILTTAFGVTIGTLVLQGLTLRPLMLRLDLEPDDTVEREVKLGRVETLRAAVSAIEKCDGDGSVELIRGRYAMQLERAQAGLEGKPIVVNGDGEFVRAAMDAQRRELIALRSKGTIGDAAFQQLQEELDLTELGWQQVVEMETAG